MSSTQTFIEDGSVALEEAIRGFQRLRPGLLHDEKHRVIYRQRSGTSDRVTLLSGGGSGHEPAHVGYVGSSMLDAAVCGNIFASPSAKQIEAGLSLVRSSKGILIIVKNYTGDKLNFTLAAERHCYATGSSVRLIVVADDVSIGRTKSARVGRRGLAGTVLIHKIAGGAASAGWSLDQVAKISEFALSNMGTIGVALDGCEIPGQPQTPQPRLSADEVEIGIGIHNEPGSKRVSPKPSLNVLIASMLMAILDETDHERNYLATHPHSGESDVVLLVNNLGGLSALEIAAVTNGVCKQLESKYDIRPCRVLAGTFLSALNGPGFSITLVSLPKSETLSPDVLKFLDVHTDALGWFSSISSEIWPAAGAEVDSKLPLTSLENKEPRDVGLPVIPCDPRIIACLINSVNLSLIAAEPEITRLDMIMGDGDCGTTLVTGSNALCQAVNAGSIDTHNLGQSIMAIADTVSLTMGGTSGALYAVFFAAFASSICNNFKKTETCGFSCIIDALKSALRSLMNVTMARKGDRTMMDALIPFVDTMVARQSAGVVTALNDAVMAAKDGCDATKHMESMFGRSTYVAVEDTKDSTEGLADPGACGIVTIVEGVRNALRGYV